MTPKPAPNKRAGRDMIEEALNIKGFPILLTDTAGLHDSGDPIEILGINKTLANIQIADMILFMVEANRPLTEDDHKIYQKIQSKPFIVVINKVDLVNGKSPVTLPTAWGKSDCIEISALYEKGIEELKEKIVFTGFGKEPIDIASCVVPNLRQKLLLEDSLVASETIIRELEGQTPMELIAIQLQDAIDSLGQIIGANVKVDVLDQIFSRFCIGK